MFVFSRVCAPNCDRVFRQAGTHRFAQALVARPSSPRSLGAEPERVANSARKHHHFPEETLFVHQDVCLFAAVPLSFFFLACLLFFFFTIFFLKKYVFTTAIVSKDIICPSKSLLLIQLVDEFPFKPPMSLPSDVASSRTSIVA